jgi:two-component system response regulator AtoC
MKRILIIDDEANLRHMLRMLLEKEGYSVTESGDGEDALKILERDAHDFVLCDVRMPKMDGMQFLAAAREAGLSPAVIMMTAYGTIETAAEAMKNGAIDYISKPFKNDEVLLRLRIAEERMKLVVEVASLKRAVRRDYSFESVITQDPGMLRIIDTNKKIADYKTTVLITGESGTGKEIIAKAVHFNGSRSGKSFVTINCGAIPVNLLESELFGHQKGSFTGAIRTKRGLFEEANEGTIFLDEIGELPLELQVKLLRVLQEEEIRRIGENRPIHVDVRVLAASARNLKTEVEQGRFRSDLYFRLNVLIIDLPPLRNRKDDLPLLIVHFLKKFNAKLGKSIEGIDEDAMRKLMSHNWPGNIRELENCIERAVLLTAANTVTVQSLPPYLSEVKESQTAQLPAGNLSIKKAAAATEKDLIEKALDRTGGNRTHAAKLLEINHRTILYKIKEYNIDVTKYRRGATVENDG